MKHNHTLKSNIIDHLASFSIIEQQSERYAAVALIIVEQGYGANLPGLNNFTEWQNDASVILTRRAKTMSKHAGQWALPGGRLDTNETPLQAAKRETVEEINLTLTDEHYLGRLDDYVTRSGFVMSPMIFWIDNTDEMQANPSEVDSIHRIPCSEFLRKDAPLLDYNELEESDRLDNSNHPVLRMPVGDHWIAAPTAAILYQLREVCLLGRKTRVAHFEQPKFAWR